MARIAERLILLNNVSQGLMARVHHLLSFKRPAVLDSQLDKVCQKFVKKFPDFQANAIEKGPAYNLFKQHATEVHSSLYAYYYTLVDVAHIKDESLKLLNDVASDMLDLTFDVMRDLTIWFMELLTNIVQLLLLVDRLDDRKEFTIIFAYSFYFTQSTYEPNYQKVSKFLIDCSSPIRQLQDDCEQISHRVIHTLLALSPRFVEHSQLTVIRDKGYLNLCDAPDQLSKSACADLYFELQNIERFRKWILYGFLVVPSALEKDEVRDVIRLALQFGLVVPIYRDQLINIHELYGGLFTSPNFKKLKLSKSKEIAKSAYAYALNDSVAEHADSRRFLRATISVFCSLLNAAPELLTPKFPVLLAAISLCRQEISWYFSHLSARNPMQKDWSKWSQLEGFDDEYIGELLFHVNSLTTLVSTRSDIIRDYYLSYLRNGVEVLIGLADELKKDTRLSNYSSNLLQAVVDFDSNSSSSESFEAFVMNCHRLSAQLMSAQAGSRNPATRALIVHLNSVIFRAQCVSLLPNLVKTYGSLSQLYFFGGELKEAFAQCLRSRGHIPRYCLSFIFIYAEAKHNLHQCCPEENALIATESVRLAEEGLTEISNAIANCLRTLSTSFLQLASEGNIAGNRPNPESHPFDEAYRSIEYSRQLCSNLCTAFRECQTIQVFDQQLCPGQYLVQSIRTCAKDVLRAAASSSGNVEIPSKFRFKSKIIFRAIQEIQSHIDIGTESLFREVLSEEMPASKKRNSDPIAPGQSNHIQK